MEPTAPQVSTRTRLRTAMACQRAAGMAVHDPMSVQSMATDTPAAQVS
jgi:hypothetical protein